ncbi:hypothetical protein FA95DRAFT_1468167, partial [Auriscalpium vulgare]
AMVDSGVTALFLSRRFVKKHNVFTRALSQPIPLFNIDGSRNQAGGITHFARLQL